MRAISRLAIVGTLALTAAPSVAEAPLPPNPQIDYAGFDRLVREIGPVREAHRLPWPEFRTLSRTSRAILLDTRSASAFAQGHLKGAVNLPFSDFTDEKLRQVLGPDLGRPIYIYCNNNFTDNVAPVVSKP